MGWRGEGGACEALVTAAYPHLRSLPSDRVAHHLLSWTFRAVGIIRRPGRSNQMRQRAPGSQVAGGYEIGSSSYDASAP
jgi:hypothetical protein